MFIVRNQAGNIVMEVISIRIARIKDRDTNQVKRWNIVGSLPTGKDVTIARYEQEEDANRDFTEMFEQIANVREIVDVSAFK